MWNKTDMSQSGFSQDMEKRVRLYNNLTLSAERCRRDSFGKMTRAERDYYAQAANVCEQIVSLNPAEDGIRQKWIGRRKDCLRMVEKIDAFLNPPPPPPPPKPPVAPKTPVTPKAPPFGSTSATDTPSPDELKWRPEGPSRHACEDVKAETIAKWYQPKPSKGFDGITGMNDLKDRLLKETSQFGWGKTDEYLNISPVQSYFLYGPAGTGKTTFVKAFAHEMMEKDENFRFLQLRGGDIHQSYVGVAEKVIEIVFKEAADNAPCLIFIDEIEGVCADRNKPNIASHESNLTIAFLQAYNLLKESGKQVIFMGATNHPGLVDTAMMDRIKLVKVPLPDEPARASYFTRKYEKLTLDDSLTIDTMVDRTDNYSYRDLDRLAESISLQLKDTLTADYKILDEDGNIDHEASDEAASTALKEGKVQVTLTMFESAQKENPLTDQSAIREELRAFEERAARPE